MAESPYLVVGLGNPGAKYDDTPHNIGFRIVDALATRWGVSFSRKFDGEFADATFRGSRVYLLKPQTYMNLSGRSVGPAAGFYKVPVATNLLIVSDEIDLPPGHLRLRHSGSSGGHNGLKSIEDSLGTNGFPRLRVGVGRGTPLPPDVWVLKKMTAEMRKQYDEIVDRAVEGIELAVTEGIEKAMNVVNRKPAPPVGANS